MKILNKKDFLFEDVTKLTGVGKKLSQYLKKKKIEKIIDLIWNIPYSHTDRSNSVQLNELQIGKIFTIKVKVKKYNFPRIRNLPNKIMCEDDFGKIDLVFFNSREGYIRKILPLNEWVVVSGKINFFKNKYQITNPDYITNISEIDYVKKKIPKYALTEGLNEKLYRKIIDQVIKNLPDIDEWHDIGIINEMNFPNWKSSIIKLHQNNENKDLDSSFLRRIAYDEIFANLIILSKNRNNIKRDKKTKKKFNRKIVNKLVSSLPYILTNSQKNVIEEIENDLLSKKRMFRILQGDVGSGKTIVSLIAAVNTIEAGFQVALMAPTEILAQQHYKLAIKTFNKFNIKVELLTGKTEPKIKKIVLEKLKEKKIDFLIGTHALFQKKIEFKKLGFIIIDEQHKFGVRQRMNLAKKGGDNCDVLLMSATPIPRTMMMAVYGDMDVSKITEKPLNRKEVVTLSKPENKINEVISFIKNTIINKDQVFWVCPLIEDSSKLDFSSTKRKFDFINKIFPNKVGLIHGSLSNEEKQLVLKRFLKKEVLILVSTTVIEVGVDFPNATVMVIENANKFGLAQLHQLRGRIGRGKKSGTCILLFKGNLSKNAKKRIKILKEHNDGFYIAEEDMKLRGFGDIIGFKQSGIKYFKIADPVHHEDLFKKAEINIKNISAEDLNNHQYNLLLKLFDKVDIINELDVEN